jgi:uncharacterized protein (DUF58 family)
LSVSCDTRPRIYRTGAAANPRPRPLVGGGDQPSGDRVLEDVLQRGLELLLRLDQSRGKAFPEDVVTASVERVEGACIFAVEIAHPGGEVGLRRLDEQVIVVAQQAAGMETPAVPARHAAELVQEDPAVVVVQEAQRLVVPAGRDVVPSAGGEIATGTGHASTVALSGLLRMSPDEFGTGL